MSVLRVSLIKSESIFCVILHYKYNKVVDAIIDGKFVDVEFQKCRDFTVYI